MHQARNFKIICIFLFLFYLTKGNAQDTINSAIVEQKSYQLFQDKNWDGLIEFGNKQIKNGFTYFYLEMRIGIAWFEKKNYRVAENHFKSALTYNSGDVLAQEYLYYCYLYSGKHDDAMVFSKSFPSDLAKKLGTDSVSSLAFALAEGGIKTSDRSDLFNTAYYFQLGIGHDVKRRVSLFHALTYFNQSDFRGKTIQFQYYLKANVPLKKNWTVSPAVHWVKKDYTPNVMKPPPSNSGMGPRPKPKAPTTTKTNYFIGSLGIKKSIARFDVSIGTTYSTIDSAGQYIHTASLNYFPFGNNRISLGGNYYLHSENNYADLNQAVSASLTIYPVKRFSIAANYFYNTKNNIIESNGYLVNNSFGFTPSRYSILANVSLGKHLEIYGLYQFENKEEPIGKFNYYYNAIILGLKLIP